MLKQSKIDQNCQILTKSCHPITNDPFLLREKHADSCVLVTKVFIRMERSISHLLKAREAAQYLGVSLNTLYRMEQNGHIAPFRTPGGHRRYSYEMLDRYLERSRLRFNHRSSDR